MRSKTTWFLSAVVLVILMILAGGVVFIKSDYAADWMCAMVRDGLEKNLGLQTSIRSCSIGLLPPFLEGQQIEIAGRDGGRWLRILRLRIELDSFALLTGRFRVDRVWVEQPELNLTLVDETIANLLQPKDRGRPSDGQGDRLIPARFDIEDARVNLVIEKLGLLQLAKIRLMIVARGEQQHEVVAEVGGGTLELMGGQGVSLALEGCKLKAKLDQNGLELDRFTLKIDRVNLEAHGRITTGLGKLEPRLNLKLTGPTALLRSFLPTVPPMEGMVWLNADATVGGQGPQARGTLEVSEYGIGPAKNITLKTGFLLDGQNLEFDNLSIASPAGAVSGNARLSLLTPLAFSGSLNIKRAELKQALSMADIHSSPVLLRTSGEVEFKGKFQAKRGPFVVLSSRLGLERVMVRPESVEQPVLSFEGGWLQAKASFSGARVRIPAFRLELRQSVIEGGGQIYFSDGAVTASIRSAHLDLGDFSKIAGTNIGGVGSFAFQASGNLQKPMLEVELETQGLVVEGQPLGSVRGRMTLAEGELKLDRTVVAGRGRKMKLSGFLGIEPPYKIGASVDLVGVKLPDFIAVAQKKPPPPFLDGRVSGRLKVSGSLAQPTLDFVLTFHDVKLGEQDFEEGGFIGRFDRGTWRFDLLEARMGPGWLFARGEISPNQEVDLTAYSTGLRASSFRSLDQFKDLLDFRLDLNVSVKGRMSSPSIAGWVKVYDMLVGGQSVPDSFVSAQATTETFQVEGRFLGGDAVLLGQARLEEGLPFSASLQINSDWLGSFFPPLPSGLRVRGLIHGSAVASGRLLSPGTIQGELKLDQLALETTSLHLESRQPVVVKLGEGAFQIEQCVFAGDDTTLSLQGGGSLKNGPRLEVEGSVGLGWLPVVTDAVKRAVGQAKVSLRLFGPWGAPQLSGSADFSADLLRFSGFPEDVGAVTGAVRLFPNLLELTRVSGKVGSGTFSGQGKLELFNFAPGSFALSFDLDRVRYNVTKNLWGVGTGVLGLSGRRGEPALLSGEVRIHQAAYREHISLVSLSEGLFRRRLPQAHAYSQERERFAFDLRLLVPSNLQVGYNLDLVNFQAEMKGELRLTGTNERMGLMGELEALDGTVNYLTKNFAIQSARVQFVDKFSFHPKVDVLASLTETVDRGEEGEIYYRVDLRLAADGDEKPDMVLKSNPPLSERDIVTLLHFGVTSREVESLKSEDLVGLGGEILFRSFKLDERLRKLFPFPPEMIQAKYLRLRSRFSERTGAKAGSVSPRLEVGAKLRLLSDNLDLEYGRSLFDNTDQSLDLSYKLSEEVSTRLRWENAEQDSPLGNMGDLGLDLKLHWEW